MRKIPALLLMVTLLLTACAPGAATPPALVDPLGLARYEGPGGSFTLNLPSDWIVNDLSDGRSIRVEFSPAGAAAPLAAVTVIDAEALNPGALIQGPSGPDYDLDALISSYLAISYTQPDSVMRDMDRTLQPDGSLRLAFALDRPDGYSQHNDFVQLFGAVFTALRITLPPDDANMTRTLSRIAGSFAFNPESEWALASGQPALAGGGVGTVGFASLLHRDQPGGGFEILGQVANNADAPLALVQVRAELYDSAGILLASADDFVSTDLLLPGEFAPFAISFPGGLPEGAVRYDLQASAQYTTLEASRYYGGDSLAVTSSAGFDEDGVLTISGQVRNEGAATAGLVKVIITVFDEQQRVIATSTSLVDQQRLAPGETSPYSASFVGFTGNPATFQVTAQGVLE